MTKKHNFIDNWKEKIFEYKFEIFFISISAAVLLLGIAKIIKQDVVFFIDVVLIGITVLSLRLSVVLTKLIEEPLKTVEVVCDAEEAIKKVSDCIDKATHSIYVYGRGPGHLNEKNTQYMGSILAFLRKRSVSYYRILVVSRNIPDASFLWLYFMKHLLQKYGDKIEFQVCEKDVPPDVLTPFQIIDNMVTHYVHGSLSDAHDRDQQVKHPISTFYYEHAVCSYFKEFYLRDLWNTQQSRKIGLNNIDEYLLKYREECSSEFVEKAEIFIKNLIEI